MNIASHGTFRFTICRGTFPAIIITSLFGGESAVQRIDFISANLADPFTLYLADAVVFQKGKLPNTTALGCLAVPDHLLVWGHKGETNNQGLSCPSKATLFCCAG